MANEAHTAGPWVNRGHYNGLMDEIGVAGRAVAVVWTRKWPQQRDEISRAAPCEEGEANARLIAAAPLLLEALCELKQFLDMFLAVTGGLPPEANGPAAKALAAIAAATNGGA